VYHSKVPLVLASASPRRYDLLRAAGLSCTVDPACTDESVRMGETPDTYARRVALEKARAVCGRHPDEWVLGADTVVVIEGEILGKPVNADDAARMLRLLSGRTHEVLTGVALRRGDCEVSHVEATRVRFGAVGEHEIAWYVASGEPMDKAGAYAVQGLASRFVEVIEGSYSNVVGLPVAQVYRMFRDLGIVDVVHA
jgi:septum formation protein